jgi:hypothetical protein
MAIARDKLVQTRVTQKMKEAISKKIEILNNKDDAFEKITESEVILRLLEKWLKGEIEI